MFLKSLLLGLRRKLGEPIMILLTVAIAVAVFVSALALRDSIRETTVASYRAFSGEASLEASLSEDYPAYYVTAEDASYRALSAECDKYGALYSGYLFYASVGKEQGVFATVYATDREALSRYNPVECISGEVTTSRTGVVISESFAERIGARVGDGLTAGRYGSEQTAVLTVTGIAKEKGLFTGAQILVSEQTASRLLSLGDNLRVYNRFFIELSDEKINALGMSEQDAMAAIDSACSDFDVASPVNDKNVEVSLSYQSTLLLVVALIVAALGAILIYTAVTLVMKSRLATAALFKSVGATSVGLTMYLLAEIFLYGVVGSAVGVGGSYAVGAIFGAMTGSAASFSVGVGTAFLGVLFGVALALLSALIPVLRLSFSPLSELLRSHSPIWRLRVLPAVVSAAVFLALFLATAFAGVSAAFTLGAFAALALIALLFTVIPFAVKGVSVLLMRVTRDRPSVSKIYLAATGARSNRHAQSGARLLAIAVLAVLSIAVLLGEASHQLRSFDSLFRADIMISADSAEIPAVTADARSVEGVSGAYFAYVETRCSIEGEEENTVSFFAARLQEYESVFRAADFGVDASSLSGAGRAAMGGGLAMKLGLEIGDEFSLIVNGARKTFTLASVIDTPLTVVFVDLSGLGIPPNLCLAAGTDDAFSRLSEKYALTGAVYRASDAFGYVTTLAADYIRVFALFEVLVFLFAFAGYLNAALASYRDRRREYELLAAVGASRRDRAQLVAWENGIVVLTAVLLGAATSFALLFIVENMLKSLGLYFTLLG